MGGQAPEQIWPMIKKVATKCEAMKFSTVLEHSFQCVCVRVFEKKKVAKFAPWTKKTIKNLLPEPWNELCVLEIGGYGSLPSISSHLMNGRAHGTKMPFTHTHTTMNVKPNDVKESEKQEQKIISVSQMKWENAKWRWRKWANKVLISAPIALNRYWICTKALYSIYDTNTYNRTQNTHNHTHTLSTRSVPFFSVCVLSMLLLLPLLLLPECSFFLDIFVFVSLAFISSGIK